MTVTGNLKRRTVRTRGFSLVEALMTSIIFVALLAAVYGALGDTMGMYGVQGTYARMQMDGRRALERVSHELRMSGRFDNPVPGQPGYPYIFPDGFALGLFAGERHDPATKHVPAANPAFGESREIVFKIPRDEDGDGLLTQAANGNIEWSDADISYVLITDAAGINTLYRRENAVITDVIAQYVERVTFDTIDTDPTIGISEIVITLYMARPTQSGQWMFSNFSTCVTMRNTEEAH